MIPYLLHPFLSDDAPGPTHRGGFEPALRSLAHFQGVVLSRLERDISQRQDPGQDSHHVHLFLKGPCESICEPWVDVNGLIDD